MALDLGIFLQGSTSSNKVKVTDNDALAQYLKDKITSVDASVTITERNDGGVETLDLAVGGSSDTNIANTNLTNDANRVVDLNGFKTGFTGGELGVGSALPDDSAQLDVSSTDKGLLIPRVTTAQMNAIVSPATNLLVFNTDLEALYRYDGANWVALSAGYGIVEVIGSSDNGVPTYYATLSSALNACKTTGEHFQVNLRSNVEETSTISITAANGFDFASLTIDLGGFEVVNNQANTDHLLVFRFTNNAAEKQRLVIKNGYLTRTSNTSGLTLYGEPSFYGGFGMENVVCYNQNSGCASLQISQTWGNNYQNFVDLGGSVFISGASGIGILLNTGNYQNFIGYSDGAEGVYINSTGTVKNFHAESNTGNGCRIQGQFTTHFTAVSNSGYGVRVDNDNEEEVCSFFYCKSNSNYALYMSAGGDYATNFRAYSVNGTAAFLSEARVENGVFVSDNSNGLHMRASYANNITALSIAGTYGADIFRDNKVKNSTFTAMAGIGARITDDNAVGTSTQILNCVFSSEWDNTGGHAALIHTTVQTPSLGNCSFQVANASANCLNAVAARNLLLANSCYFGATTPVNANITLTNTSAPDAYGNIDLS